MIHSRLFRSGGGNPGFRPYIAGLVFFLFLAVFAQRAEACCCAECTPTVEAKSAEIIKTITSEHKSTRDHITQEFDDHEEWLIETYFKKHILPAMMMMTEQLSSVAMQQMMILGSFFDAKHQLETERLYQQLAAQAHKDYHPNEGFLCTVGSTTRSLAKSDRNADLTAMVMAQRSLDRQLLNANASSASGPPSDRASRLAQFTSTYCDRNDNNGALEDVCAGNVPQGRKNKDIDFSRTVGLPLTLDVDFSNGNVTPDEEDVLALSSNLYAHDVFRQIPEALLRNNPGGQQKYLDLRAIAAKRSVAEQSFQAITAMKSSGATNAAETAKYMRAVLRELGVPSDDEATLILGENPSYYAQMEVLTKKVFERPEFFTDLYDKPANVARKGVAIQALGLIQDRDLFKSNLRNEAMMSILVELELMKAQRNVENEGNRITERK